MAKLKRKKNKMNCPLDGCPNKDTKPHSVGGKALGTPVGHGGTLGANLMKVYWASDSSMTKAKHHPFSVHPKGSIAQSFRRKTKKDIELNRSNPSYRSYSAQAHHLICSEAFTNGAGEILDKWKNACYIHGYDINCAENGIFLPSYMPIACHFKIPLHHGNHEDALTMDTQIKYVDAVMGLTDSKISKRRQKSYCKKVEGKFVEEMNEISKTIWGHVKGFNWRLTKYGDQFGTGTKGCLGCLEIKEKEEATITVCPSARNHTALLNLFPKIKPLLNQVQEYDFPDKK